MNPPNESLELVNHPIWDEPAATKFMPMVRWDRDGDCIQFVALPGPFFAQRICDVLTVYLSRATREVVGCQIKNAAKLMEYPAVRIAWAGQKVGLEVLLTLRANEFGAIEENRAAAFRNLYRIAKDHSVPSQELVET